VRGGADADAQLEAQLADAAAPRRCGVFFFVFLFNW
jgi:hypothetical protein